MKTKTISTVLLLFFLCALSASSMISRNRLPDFAVYLKDAGLTALYRTEIKTLCLEYGDPAACREAARMLVHGREPARAATLLDSITHRDRRAEFTSKLLRARILVELGEYEEASETAGAVIEAMPAKDLLIEAVLVKAQCQYHLGSVEEASMNLRSIRPFVPEGRAPTLPLYLGLCEEAEGNLEDAKPLFEEAETGGSPDAELGLLRLALKQGDLEEFFVLADEFAESGRGLPARDVCLLAGEIESVLPEAWHALTEPVVAHEGFDPKTCPELIGSLVRLAEVGEDVSRYCDALLARPVSGRASDWLRYARALSREDTASCDTLELLSRTAAGRDIKARCIAACLTCADEEERPVFARRMLPTLNGLWSHITPLDQKEMAMLILESGQPETGAGRLLGLAENLRVGYDDAAMFAVAEAVERSGDKARTAPLYRTLAGSPIPSEQSLAAARSLYLLEKTGRGDEDLAGVVERVAEEGVSPLEIGDLFMDRLKDFDRAASFYRRALNDPPDGVPPEGVKIRLAEALAARALITEDSELRGECLGLISGIADTSIVAAYDVLRVLEVSTDWLREERGAALSVLQNLGRRQDLTSSELYRIARLLYHLFSERDGNVYARCAMTLRRLADEYPTSIEAPLGAFLAARLKFSAGDYVGALEAYEACREVWRNHTVTSLCEEGIADCYLYSGGAGEALGHYREVPPSPRVALKIAECFELSDRPDSALRYYDIGLEKISATGLSDLISLRRCLLALEESGSDAALPLMDSAVPAVRERLRPLRRMAAAYGLGRAGYRKPVMDILTSASGGDGEFACEALLLLSKLEPDGEPEARLARLRDGESICTSIFGALRLLHERAYLACSSGPLEACARERKRYQQRFPLDRGARLDFDIHRTLLLFREGLGDSAGVVIDSLAGGGRVRDALAYGIYRKGIHHMVEGDYAQALEAFLRVKRDYPNSDLYFDTLLKLGTACYMLERFDSSAVYFEAAVEAGEASVVENAYFNLGLALEEAGRLEPASRAFLALAMRFPFSERFDRALMRAAYTLERAGRPDEAIRIYRDLLQYAEAPETAAEAMYWIGESFAEMGEPIRAACEFLRVAYLFPDGGPWTGTAAFRAGMECEKAGLMDHALLIYRENVRKFGLETDWGSASGDRLDELSKPQPAVEEAPERAPEGADE